MHWDGGLPDFLVGFVAASKTDGMVTVSLRQRTETQQGRRTALMGPGWSLHVSPRACWVPAYQGLTILPKINYGMQRHSLHVDVTAGKVHVIAGNLSQAHRRTMAMSRQCVVKRTIELTRPSCGPLPELEVPDFGGSAWNDLAGVNTVSTLL